MLVHGWSILTTEPLSRQVALEKYANALKLKQGEYHFPNLCGVDERSNAAATLRGAGFEDWELCTCALLALRNSLFGASVVPEPLRAVYDDMQLSFQRAGIAVDSNPLFVEDLFSYGKAFSQLGRNIKLLPYQQSVAFASLLNEHRLGLVGPSDRGLEVTNWARNKTSFRNFVGSVSPSMLSYPRVSLEKGQKAKVAVGEILKCLEFSLSYKPDNQNTHSKLLFIQLTEGAGGLGNFIVQSSCEVHSDELASSIVDWKFEVLNPDRTVDDLLGGEALFNWLDEKLQENSLEVAPFLEILYSFSIAAVVDENSVVCVGRTQNLDDQNAYVGYLWPKLQAEDASFMLHYDKALEFQRNFSAYLHRQEFYRTDGGALTQGVDFAVVRLPNGEESLIAVECNCRAQAPQATEMLALNVKPWRRLIEDDQMVLLGMDHLECPGIQTGSQLQSLLVEQNFPMSSVSQPYGILPIVVSHGQAIALFTGKDEDHARKLLERYLGIMAS